jgi:nondiscriminating aspartyl-tRNA synthetase
METTKVESEGTKATTEPISTQVTEEKKDAAKKEKGGPTSKELAKQKRLEERQKKVT